MEQAAHRKKFGERLRGEMDRSGLSVDQLASEAGLRVAFVQGYLIGERKIILEEVKSLCAVVGADPMRLLSRGYRKPQLSYRNASKVARQFAARVENAFLLIKDWLTIPSRPSCPMPRLDEGAAVVLLAETRQSVESLRAAHQNVEALYDAHRLPVLWLSAGSDGFDAFLLSQKPNFLVVVNSDKPTSRIEFSLLHEFAHFAFDADREVPLDEHLLTPTDLYGDVVPPHARCEYVANKFAQLWLVAFDDAERFSRHPSQAATFVRDQRISPDVVANAMYDVLRSKGQVRKIQDIKESFWSPDNRWEGRMELRNWLAQRSDLLRFDVARGLDENLGLGRQAEVMSAIGGLDE